MSRNSSAKSTSFSRMSKINEILHRELAKLISLECKDPRLGMVTITGVETSKDLSIAKVFITVLEEEKLEQSLKILQHASGFLRTELSHQVKMRKMPALRFIYDSSVLAGSKIESLFAKLDGHGHTAQEADPELDTED